MMYMLQQDTSSFGGVLPVLCGVHTCQSRKYGSLEFYIPCGFRVFCIIGLQVFPFSAAEAKR